MKKSKWFSIILVVTMIMSIISISPAASALSVSFPADGDYYIVPEANSNYALDVTGGGDAAVGTSIQLYEKNNTDAQIFTIKRVDGDWYTITHKRTGYVINVENGSSYNDARFWIHPFDNTDACFFRFGAIGSSYVIQSRVGAQRVVDLDNAYCFNGSIVHLWDAHAGLSARWYLVPVSSSTSSQQTAPSSSTNTIKVSFPADGDYYIAPEANNNYALDVAGGGAAAVGTSIQLYEKNNTDAQIFTIKRVDGDWYTITHKRTGYVINVENGSSYNDARLWVHPFDNTDACFFRFGAIGSSYVIQSRVGAQRVVDLDNANCFNGSIVHLWDAHAGLSARWCLIPVSSSLPNSTPSVSCFARYTGKSTSIVAALNSLGINSSYSNRTKIAAANGINNYTGTASQNTTLLTLLKNGKLINPDATSAGTAPSISYFAKYTGNSTSIVTALNSLGITSTYAYRAKIAATNGINNYTGTALQNTTLLTLLKNGSLINPDLTSSSTNNANNSNSGDVITNSSYNVSVTPKSKENQPHYTNTSGQRSAEALNTVLDQFNVTTNSRYKATSSATYCNIFVWDCTSALNCEIPHWILKNTPASSTTQNATELNVNATYNWLNNYGTQYGWRTVSAEEAQQRANSGYPTIAIWKNTSGGSGHIAMVRPEGNGYSYSSNTGPVITQAGANNYSYANVSTGFGASKISAIVYWTHD